MKFWPLALLWILLAAESSAQLADFEPELPTTHTYIAPVSSAEGYYPVCRYKEGTLFLAPLGEVCRLMDPEKSPTDTFNPGSKIALYKEGKIRIWARDCPLLTQVWISDDSRYIVGLSSIKFFNPIQLVVYDREGNLLHAQSMFAQGARFTPEELQENPLGFLASSAGRLEHEGFVYLNILGSSLRSEEPMQSDIEQRTVQNPLSSSFAETPNNYVYWFDQEDPQLSIREVEGKAFLTFADPLGQLITLPLDQAAP